MDKGDLQDQREVRAQADNQPTIIAWNRLEARPRTRTFDRALRAEVRDALWMLTRQWQTGELNGQDAGSPIGVQVEIATTHLNRKQVAGVTTPYADDTPLEAIVEHLPIAFLRGDSKIQLDLRVELGRRWNKLLGAKQLGAYQAAYRAKYPFVLPPDDRSSAAADVYAHTQARQGLSAIAGRCTDGGDLYLYLTKAPSNHASDGITLSDPAHGAMLDALGARLVAWFNAQYFQPDGPVAWRPSSLEYAFDVVAPDGTAETVLTADEYPGGNLDWYSLDVKARPPAAREVAPSRWVKSLLPTPLTFDGMPSPRWWKFEDSKVSLGDISPSTTDLAKLLLIEFALVYANDWYLIPFRLPAGSLANIRTMVVTNSFNERFKIEAAGSGPESAWQSWRMFTLSSRGKAQADTTMFLAPTVPKIQSGDPLDEIYFVRDEMADMVWAVETQVPLVTGVSRPGGEVGRETLRYHQPQQTVATAPYNAPIYYQPMTAVPENWIPFIPVHVEGSNREIQLQRGALRRPVDGQPIRPATPSLRQGLDQNQALFVHEEQVPRAGTQITRAFQRTRWQGGRTFVWLAMAHETGRGEDQSRLAFDQIAVPGGTW
jgi:hypothetical protein